MALVLIDELQVAGAGTAGSLVGLDRKTQPIAFFNFSQSGFANRGNVDECVPNARLICTRKPNPRSTLKKFACASEASSNSKMMLK